MLRGPRKYKVEQYSRDRDVQKLTGGHNGEAKLELQVANMLTEVKEPFQSVHGEQAVPEAPPTPGHVLSGDRLVHPHTVPSTNSLTFSHLRGHMHLLGLTNRHNIQHFVMSQ